ncbi:hypothetical protein VSU19_08340 [Verrucomicrobiales bacterium BCK34]|nr:hypothetical protein [Verrucomicrobiales bacterium BCK34]
MIRLSAGSWVRFIRISQLFTIPAVIYLFWRPSWTLDPLAVVLAYAFIIVVGLSGAIIAIGKRLGWIELQWDEDSKRSLLYKMERFADSMNPRK